MPQSTLVETAFALTALLDLDVEALDRQGNHYLCRISADWFVLVGPDDTTDTSWAFPRLLQLAAPGLAEWDATFETVGDVLFTHFTRD